MLNKYNDYKNLPKLTIFNYRPVNRPRLENQLVINKELTDEYSAFCQDVCDFILGGECACGNCSDALDIGANPAANTRDGGAGMLDALDALTGALFVALNFNSSKVVYGKNKQQKMLGTKSDLRKFRSWGGVFKGHKVNDFMMIDKINKRNVLSR